MGESLIPVSTGELFDKYTILLIKKEKVFDTKKLICIEKEIKLLSSYVNKILNDDYYELHLKMHELKDINGKLWDIEDNIRMKEKNNIFDDEFIQLARSVYITNDERFRIKTAINKITSSEITEIKSYDYL